MITAILIITGISLINLIILVLIKWNQEYYWEDLNKRQHHITNDLIDIGRTVRAIDKKIDKKKIKTLQADRHSIRRV